MCAKVVVQAGIVEVVYEKDGGNGPCYISSRKTLTKCLGANNIRLVL